MNNDIFQHYQGYQLLIKRLQQATDKYHKYYYPIEFDFYNPDSIEIIKKFLGNSVAYSFYGGYKEATRKMIVIGEDLDQKDYIECLAAKYNSNFSNIDNRDVKGALYNLGIDIDKTGDFFVQDNHIYLYCKKDISLWLIDNFKKIANLSVNFSSCQFVDQKFMFDSFNIICPNTRLDKIVSCIIRKSREIAKNKILSQDVNVNFKTINQNDYNCQLNDIISIKKVGRFKIKDIQTNPKSGKIILSIDKYR